MSERPPSDSPYELAPKSESPPPAPAPAPELTPRGAPVPPPAAPSLAERTCPHCGFRIVGKPPRGRCPECAAALDEVATDLLQFADRRWVLGLSNGALLLAAATLLQVVASVMIWRAGAGGGGDSTVWEAGDLLHGVAGILAAAAVWLLTITEPGTAVSRTPMAPLARLAALLVGALWAAAIFLPHPAPPAPNGTQPQPLSGHAQPLTVIIILATALMAVLVALHLRRLARRIPSDGLVAQLLNVAALIVAMCLLLGVLHILGLADPENLRFTFMFVFPMTTVMSLILVWALWTLLRAALEFRHCAAAGQTILARQALRAEAAQAKR